jgi:sulfur dioxygenase
VFRQMQCVTSNTFTYLLGCAKTREAVIIDPVLGNVDRDVAVALELDLKIVMSLETHVCCLLFCLCSVFFVFFCF